MGAAVLDQAIEERQGAQLAVQVAVLELLPDGAGGLSGAGGLQLDDVDEVGEPAEVVDGDGLARQPLDVDGDG